MKELIAIKEYKEAVYVYLFVPKLNTVKIGHSSHVNSFIRATRCHRKWSPQKHWTYSDGHPQAGSLKRSSRGGIFDSST